MQDRSANALRNGLTAAACSALLTAVVLAALGYGSQLAAAWQPHSASRHQGNADTGVQTAEPTYRLYIPIVPITIDRIGPDVSVQVLENGVAVVAVDGQYVIPHLHSVPLDHYQLDIAANDPSGVRVTGIDTTGEGGIDKAGDRFPIYARALGTLAINVVAIDRLENKTVKPITITLTNETPTAPVLVEGNLEVPIGTFGYAKFSATAPNRDPLIYIIEGALPDNASFNDQTGVLRVQPQTATAMFSGQYPLTLTIAAQEAPHSHSPELASEPITVEIRIVDHNPPDSVDLVLYSEHPERVTAVFHIPEDDIGYGRIRDIEFAVAQHPISDADWAAPGPDVQIYSLRDLRDYTEPFFTSGDPWEITLDASSGGTFYADARAIDAGGNVGPALDDDPSVVVQAKHMPLSTTGWTRI